MAYLPRFKHDIFISYAHDNNPGAEAGAGGRITRLHRLLEERLRELTGRELDIWRDTKLARNQEFDRTIKQAVEDSGIFLAVNSTAYRNSPYCKQEIEWFAARTQEDGYGLTIVGRKRIFNLLLEDIHYSQWPPSFRGATQYNFFEKAPGDTVTLPAEPESDQFKSEFNVLLRNLCRTLRDFKEVIETQRRRIEEPPPPSDQKFTVFLADTSEDLRRTIRRRLINELQEKGLRLAESVPPPLESEPHDEKAVAELGRAALSVHLLDEWPGREIDGAANKTYPQRQVELGMRHAKSQLIWISPHFDIQDVEIESYRQFLEKLIKDDPPVNCKVIRTTTKEISNEILSLLGEIRNAREHSVTENKQRIFISYRRDDAAPYAGRLYDHLSQRFGENAIFMDIDTIDPGEDFVLAIEEAVAACDVLIAVIGKQWVTCADQSGRRRLDNPDDFVRLEIATALKREIRVVPVLVQGAGAPKVEDLPGDLKHLARRNALEISDTRWKHDLTRLLKVLEKVIKI